MTKEIELDKQEHMLENLYLSPAASCVLEGYIWTIRNKDNLLLKINCETGTIVDSIRITNIDAVNRKSWNDRLFGIDGKILILIDYTDYILEFDINLRITKVLTYYPNQKTLTLNPLAIYNNKLFLFPYGDKNLYIYDIKKNKWDQVEISKSIIRLRRNLSEYKNEFYLLNEGTTEVYRINKDTLEYTKLVIHSCNGELEDIVGIKNKLVLLNNNNNEIIITDLTNNKVIDKIKFPEKYKFVKNWAYRLIYAYGSKIILFPYDGNMILYVDLNKKKVETLFEDVGLKESFDILGNILSQSFDEVIADKNKIYAFSTFENTWRLFDLDNMNSKKFSLFYDNYSIQDELKRINLNGLLTESKQFSLKTYICFLMNSKK